MSKTLKQWLDERHGRGRELARAIGVDDASISRYAKGQVASKNVIPIEKATKHQVKRWVMRPDIYPVPRKRK